MSDEDRKRYIEMVFNRIKETASQDPIKAAIDFLTWLRSSDGALAWPYIWKPEYVPLIRDITYYLMGFANKLLVKQMILSARR